MSTVIEEFPYISPEQQVSEFLNKTLDLGFLYRCAGMFNYGSLVYEYKKAEDIDIICVFVGKIDFCEQFTINDLNSPDKEIQITVYSEKSFLEKVHEHEISVLECLYLPKEHKLVPVSYYLETQLKSFEVDKLMLRSSISKKASNSYVKAKKKLIVEQDFDIECSLKSLWHAIRILEFGTQLAKHGKIINYKSSNWYFPEILNDYNSSDCDWEYIHEVWKPLYNTAASTFREACPKE